MRNGTGKETDFRKRKTALTIAGSDSSGGAGIQADIKTMMANGVYAMSAVTALTAQNTQCVAAVLNVTPEFLAQELDCVFDDIFPDAVKTGMLSSAELVDPVMISTSGSRLLDEEAVGVMKEELFPLAALVTPNIPEAEVLSGKKISTAEDMAAAAELISRNYKTSVLLKGGHSIADANDLLYRNGSGIWIEGQRIENPNTHGTGCALSSAIAAGLAKGYGLEEAVRQAKNYLSDALRAMLDLGKGSGPMDHGFAVDSGCA